MDVDLAQADAYARRIRKDRGELLSLLVAFRRDQGERRRTGLVIDQLEGPVTLSGERDRTLLLRTPCARPCTEIATCG